MGEEKPCCYFHPREVVIGVCPLCLNERLLILASTQGLNRSSTTSMRSLRSTHNHNHNHKPSSRISANNSYKKTPINFHKIFDFASLLHRLEFRGWKSDFNDDNHDHDLDASTSQEDSFISIKFGENGMASWEKKNNNNNNKDNTKLSKASSQQENLKKATNMMMPRRIARSQSQPKETKTVIEHGKPRGSSLRWRKRIGHLFHVVKWKRSTKGTVCHVSTKVEGVKVRKGWIRAFTKKRTVVE